MKWKAVTRRTRALGVLAVLSAATAAWAFLAMHRNPCGNGIVAAAPWTVSPTLLPAVAERGKAHFRLVQDGDDGDEEIEPGDPMEKPNPENTPHVTPCASTHETHKRLFGFSMTCLLVFSLGTVYSYDRDRRRYAKRLRGRARRAEHRRRREASYAAESVPPSKTREGFAALCACGCGEATAPGQEFVAGHAQMLRLELEQKAGGLLALRDLVESQSKPADPTDA